MPPKTPRQSGISLSAATTPILPTYSFGDIVLAKVKGHPAWPARIVDPYVSPLNLRDERKISQKNTYLVKFFKTADYAWMNAKEMSILGTTEIRAFIDNPNKKGADLKAAYQIALAPEAWEAEIENFQQEYEEQQKAIEVDELEPDENQAVGKAVPLKPKQKRKRPSEAKTPLTSAKKRKSEARATNGSGQKSSTPDPATPVVVAKKAEKKKKEEVIVPLVGESIVREWRHKLQRLFLGKTPLTEKMMPEIHEVFSDIEAFEMTSEWLHSSKLAKVLKRVGVLEDHKIPLEAKYNIKGRSRALQDKWRHALGFPEDSNNRAKVVEDNEESKSEVAPTKESELPSDAAKKSEATDTDGQKVTDDSPAPAGASAPDVESAPDVTSPVVDSIPVAASPDGASAPDVASAPVGAPASDGADTPNGADAADGAEGADATDGAPGLDGDKVEVNDAQPNDISKVEDDQQDPQMVDESVQQSPTTDIPVNGNHQETPVEDVTMAAPEDEIKADVEKPQVQENEDEGEQMDCADSPEPTSAESNNDSENKDKMVA